MTRAQGRYPSGQRLVGEAVPRNRGRVTSVLGTLILRGLIAHLEVEGGTTAEVFGRFVLDVRVPVLEPGQTVVLDSLAAHKCAALLDVIRAQGGEVVFLPPYSPELNPIECIWAKVEALLRKGCLRGPYALRLDTCAALGAIRPRDAAGGFGHCGYPVAQSN